MSYRVTVTYFTFKDKDKLILDTIIKEFVIFDNCLEWLTEIDNTYDIKHVDISSLEY